MWAGREYKRLQSCCRSGPTKEGRRLLRHVSGKGQHGRVAHEPHDDGGVFPETGRWIAGTPARIGRTGIDGLFFKTDRLGYVKDMLVAEAKFGQSQLAMTRSGKQFGEAWINTRLLRTAKNYSDLGEQIRSNKLYRATSFARLKAGNRVMVVPLRSNASAHVWQTSHRNCLLQ